MEHAKPETGDVGPTISEKALYPKKGVVSSAGVSRNVSNHNTTRLEMTGKMRGRHWCPTRVDLAVCPEFGASLRPSSFVNTCPPFTMADL